VEEIRGNPPEPVLQSPLRKPTETSLIMMIITIIVITINIAIIIKIIKRSPQN
jgi:hypothetical protein